MQTPEIIVTLLLAICILAMLAKRARISYAIVFLAGGVGLAFLPGIETFAIEPQEILTIFLPPLLMEAAMFMSLRDFHHNLRPIMQLAVGLVLLTAFAVAWVFTHIVPGATFAAGMVLGAIISPPDAVAAKSILKKLRVPKRISIILQGESLINDATGLILYKFAVAAVLTAKFSVVAAGSQFVWMVFCGLGVGLILAWCFIKLFPYIRELSVEILSTFVIPYIAYILAESFHGSGVLSVVAVGLYVSWHAPTAFTPRFRMPAIAIWKMAGFVLNALVFILIGLRIPSLFVHLGIYSTATLLWYATAICATAVIVRFAYAFVLSYATRMLFPHIRKNDPKPSWQNIFLTAYIGMRGVVSLATALALPVTITWGADFPYRDLMTYLALSLIVFTLVVQGLFLPFLMRRLTLSYDSKILHEDWNARVTAAADALEHLTQLENSDHPNPQALERIKHYYSTRLALLGDGPNTLLTPGEIPTASTHPLIQAEERLWRDVIAVERGALIRLRKDYKIGDDVMHDMLRELDLLANRFEHKR